LIFCTFLRYRAFIAVALLPLRQWGFLVRSLQYSHRYRNRIDEIRDHEWDYHKFLAENRSTACRTSFYTDHQPRR